MNGYSKKLQLQLSSILKAEKAEEKFLSLAKILKLSDAKAFSPDIEILENIPDFLQSIDKEYSKSNSHLESLHNTFTAILDTLGQGLFLFDAQGTCASAFSKSCLTLIETSPAGKNVAEVLTTNLESREIITSLIEILFSDISEIACRNDLLELFPRQFEHSAGLSIALEYRPIRNASGKLQAVLVIATDHTSEEAALQRGQEREEKVQTVLRISSNRNVFTHFFLSAVNYFGTLEENLQDMTSIDLILRDLHTLKGNGSIFNLKKFVSAVHDLETAIENCATLEQVKKAVSSAISNLMDILYEIKMEARQVLGDEFDQQGVIRSIPLDQLKAFADRLERINIARELRTEFISLFMGEPIHKQLAPFAMGLLELADRYGKNINPCEFIGENFPILSERHQPLFNSFAHISRNIIAHATEEDDVRSSYGKPVAMTVVIDTHKFTKSSQDWVRIIFTDDGAGINVEKLRAILNIPADSSMTDSEIMQHIFDDHLSTKDSVDELSGRGAGMSAIKHRAENLGGMAYVESEPHIFTRIVIEIPYVWDLKK